MLQILRTIRKTILDIKDFSAVAGFADERQIACKLGNESGTKHVHDEFELRLLFKTDANGQIDFSQLEDINIAPPYLEHRGADVSEIHRVATVTLGRREIGFSIVGKYIFFSHQDNRFAQNEQSPEEYFTFIPAALSAYMKQRSDSEHLRLIFAMLFSILCNLAATREDHTASTAEAIALHIRNYYYRKDLSIGEIAENFHLSPNYIQKVFRTRWNCTPVEYLHQVRMESARLLLRSHRYQVREVASMCGFAYVHYFCRRYREYFGTPPGSERQKS